jgi:hypothetical protein
MTETKTRAQEIAINKIKIIKMDIKLDLIEIKLTNDQVCHARAIGFDQKNSTIKFIPH